MLTPEEARMVAAKVEELSAAVDQLHAALVTAGPLQVIAAAALVGRLANETVIAAVGSAAS